MIFENWCRTNVTFDLFIASIDLSITSIDHLSANLKYKNNLKRNPVRF